MLFMALFKFSLSETKQASLWTRNGDIPFWLSRSSWSLVVIAELCKKLTQSESVIVWIPDFFCNTALEPLREMNAKFIFYPVTDKLEPNIQVCQELIKDNNIDIFLLVHFFGQPSNSIKQIASFCHSNKAFFVEDATHVLSPIAGIGEISDCIIYSPHKHLPIPNGALLLVGANGPNKIATDESAIDLLNSIVHEMRCNSVSSIRLNILWLIKRLLQLLGIKRRLSPLAFNHDHVSIKSTNNYPRLSFLSMRLLNYLQKEFNSIDEIRKVNRDLWGNLFKLVESDNFAPLDLFKSTPYLASFEVINNKNIEKIFYKTQKNGFASSTWPDLPPEVLGNKIFYPNALKFRNSIIYFPVHQTLSRGKIFQYAKKQLNYEIEDWSLKDLTHEEWKEFWINCNHTNMLQSWHYGDAKKEAEGWHPKRYLIMNENSKPVAIVQVLIKLFPLVGGIARLNRGPLLLSKELTSKEIQYKINSLNLLLKESKKKNWRMFQAAPELPNSNLSEFGLKAIGFKKLPLDPWASGLLSLKLDEDEILMSFNGKWRNTMRKGEKLGVKVKMRDCGKDELKLLLKNYQDLQKSRNFSGLSNQLIERLAIKSDSDCEFCLFTAHDNSKDYNEPLGILVSVRSGDTAIYLIGISTEQGRLMHVNSVLLWKAILHSKNSNCDWFDIGGLNESTPKGVAKFKQGLNANPYKLIGEWRKWQIF